MGSSDTLKRLLRAALAAGVILLVPSYDSAAAQSSAEIETVKKELEESADEFVKLIEPLTEEQWKFKSAKFRHTVGDEAEHIALAENDLQRVIQNALKEESDPTRASELVGKEAKVKDSMLNPTRRAESYKVPGRLNSKPEVQEFFRRAHRNLIELLDTSSASSDLKTHIYKHPNKTYDELTALQWFYYIAYHKRRHIEQIRTIMALPDFPSANASADD
jgi:hypothetical protein